MAVECVNLAISSNTSMLRNNRGSILEYTLSSFELCRTRTVILLISILSGERGYIFDVCALNLRSYLIVSPTRGHQGCRTAGKIDDHQRINETTRENNTTNHPIHVTEYMIQSAPSIPSHHCQVIPPILTIGTRSSSFPAFTGTGLTGRCTFHPSSFC